MNTIAAYSVYIAIIGGFVAPVILSFYFARWLFAYVAAKSVTSSFRVIRTIKISSMVGFSLAAVPGVLSSVMVGGTIGGGWGERLSMWLGYGVIGVPFGIFLGMTFFTTVIVCVGGVSGALLGKFLDALIVKNRT